MPILRRFAIISAAVIWERFRKVAPLNGYGHRNTMQKLNWLLFTWSAKRHYINGMRPIAGIVIFFSCLFGCQFATTAQAQPTIDSDAAAFPAGAVPEEEFMWGAMPVEPAWSEVNPFATPECIEASCSDGPKSLCVIKNRWGHTETLAIRPRDEMWIVSARNCCSCRGEEALEVKRLTSGNWQPSSLDELTNCHQTNRSLTTLMYVHGNQTDYQYGMSRGVQFYHNFVSCHEEVGPLRVVLWLWKSEQETKRMYSDFRIKSRRAIQMGEVFQATLERFGDSRMALIGFSLGTQVIVSALDSMEADKRNTCHGLDPSISQGSHASGKYRIALIAPALDPDYACSVADRTACSTLTERTSAFYNRCDRAFKALRIVVRRACPEKHVSINHLIEGQRLSLGPVHAVDLTWETGSRHSIVKYSRTPSVCRELSRMLAEVGALKFGQNQPVLSNYHEITSRF